MQKIIRMLLLLSLVFIGDAYSQEETSAFELGGHFPQAYLEQYSPEIVDWAAKKENTKTSIQSRDRIEAKKEEDQLPEYFSGLAAGSTTGLFIALNWAFAGLGAPFIGHSTAIVLVTLASIAGMLCTYSTRLQRSTMKGQIRLELENT